MKIIRDLKNITEKFRNPVLTLGNFDGVHLGHQAIFRRIVARAREIHGTSVVFTFDPHPLKVLAPDRSPRLLNTFEGKMRLFAAAGIDVVICAEFTRAFSEQTPEEFAHKVLHEQLGVKEVYVGYDYAFGKRREGGIASLKKAGHACGFSVSMVNAVQVNGVVASSSTVRDLIANGKVREASELLGRNYTVEGNVVHGSHRGHALGFPTANLSTPNELIPAYGVYAVLAHIDACQYQGVASIGVRPTFDSGPVSIEIFLFDFDGDLYGKRMEVAFVQYLREEKKFPDARSLIVQIHQDVQDARTALLDRSGTGNT